MSVEPDTPSASPQDLPDILVRIVRRRRAHLMDSSETLVSLPESPEAPCLTPETNAFLEALEHHRGQAIIAEVKMGSPRLSSLEGRIDPRAQARTYAEAGAAALSVVVEPDFFYGSYELLEACKEASGLPTIAKDFVVDPIQLRWARLAGADAVLLIAALYDADKLAQLARQARALGLVPLVETHDPADVAKLDGAQWELVGVNNRDLRTFEVSLETSIGLLPSLPGGAFKVAESGLQSGAEVERLAEAGFDAFLVGESLLLAEDPAAQLAELLGGQRP